MTDFPEATPGGKLSLAASMALADKILRDAGWTPVREVVLSGATGGERTPNIEGRFAFGNLVCGHPPEGSRMTYVSKELTKIPYATARAYGLNPDDYPDEHHEAAAWLVEHAKPLEPPISLEQVEIPRETIAFGVTDEMLLQRIEEELAQEPEQVETPQHESDGETGEAPVLENAAGDGGGAPQSDLDASDEVLGAELSELGGGSDEPLDADFTIEDLGGPEDLPELEGPIEDFAPDEIEPQDGPIAYGASTIDGLVREKLGRVSQIARELKASLQDGWTVEEYAYLQNLMVRMDRGEAPDDQASRERFLAIAAKSQAMSRIDSVRDKKEGELDDIGRRRDFDAAVYYEPGEGWP